MQWESDFHREVSTQALDDKRPTCVSSCCPLPSAPVKTELIVALDFPNAHAALNLAQQLNGVVRHCKVGKELFVAEGPAVVRALRERGMDVFLDLKFHDIPN